MRASLSASNIPPRLRRQRHRHDDDVGARQQRVQLVGTLYLTDALQARRPADRHDLALPNPPGAHRSRPTAPSRPPALRLSASDRRAHVATHPQADRWRRRRCPLAAIIRPDGQLGCAGIVRPCRAAKHRPSRQPLGDPVDAGGERLHQLQRRHAAGQIGVGRGSRTAARNTRQAARSASFGSASRRPPTALRSPVAPARAASRAARSSSVALTSRWPRRGTRTTSATLRVPNMAL